MSLSPAQERIVRLAEANWPRNATVTADDRTMFKLERLGLIIASRGFGSDYRITASVAGRKWVSEHPAPAAKIKKTEMRKTMKYLYPPAMREMAAHYVLKTCLGLMTEAEADIRAIKSSPVHTIEQAKKYNHYNKGTLRRLAAAETILTAKKE